jgi:protein-histidine pros-kinase
MDGMGEQTPYLPTLAALGVVMQAIPGPRIVVGEDEKIVLVNAAACDLLGYAPRDLVGQYVDVLKPEGPGGQIDVLRQAWAAAPESGALGRGMDLRARRADGTEVPIELQVVPWTTDEGGVVVIAIHDLTAAQYDNRLFRALLDAAPDAVVIIDDSGTIRLVNGAAERAFGYDRGELVGLPMEVLVPDRFAELHGQLREHFAAAPHPRPMGRAGTLYAKRKDGSEFPADIALSPVLTEEGPLVIADVHDLTERLAAVDEVHRAREQQNFMAEIDRMKDQFLATISHELRTPLASIVGFCELIAEVEGLDPDVQHFVSIVTRNARRETRLVEDLLTLVNIDQGGLSVRPASANLTRLVRDAVHSAQPRANAAGIDLSLEGPDGEVPIVCDPDRIGQALDGLLSNALKFTPTGGRVRVVVELLGPVANILVADSGMGIDDPNPNRVFDRLYRSPSAIERQIPGAGIGLAIASAIVAAHHGNIRVLDTSRAGTTFALELPLEGQPETNMSAG